MNGHKYRKGVSDLHQNHIAQNVETRRVLIAAHRGTAGGNIPCNTLIAYELALRDGADIIELDVSRSLDGGLFCFHPGMEPVMYVDPTPIAELNAERAASRLLRNQDMSETIYHSPTLDEALELLKDRCLVAVDKFWKWIPEIAACIRRHGMQEQVLCKLQDKPQHYEVCAHYAADLPILPVIWTEDRSTCASYAKGVRIAGVEALFAREEAPIASESYIDKQHQMGRMLWVNPIVYNNKDILTAGHTDDIAVAGNPDQGILHTDWTAQLRRYLNAGRLKPVENQGKIS